MIQNWAKWRRGYEYYNQAAWLPFQVRDPISRELRDAELKSFLYQGDFNPTDNIEVMYNGRKFATLKSDSGNHYAIKRNIIDSPPLGVIDRVDSNFEAVTDIYHPDHKYFKDLHDHHEIRAHSQSFHPLMLRMVGDRVSDGFTSATLNYVLNENTSSSALPRQVTPQTSDAVKGGGGDRQAAREQTGDGC